MVTKEKTVRFSSRLLSLRRFIRLSVADIRGSDTPLQRFARIVKEGKGEV